ncbi:hypothetical protein HELRODRAFT_85270, partial [Helobdella robusta]|uniref:Lipase n=1 Tax=Helobdella robusta TaxID=6412 RepID=T1G5U9_HELRO
SEIIRSKGYQCIDHIVQTSDGFLLSLQRVNNRSFARLDVYDTLASNDENDGKPVAFLQHGLFDASSTWVINQQHQSLGFVLADAGYDVWIGNIRGNTYSRRNVHYNPADPRFWDWSWDEMARYDIPSMLHYINNATKQRINYIGHSQGTLVAFVAFANDQHLANLVDNLIALGPVTTVGHIVGFFKLLSEIAIVPETLFKLFGIHEFLSSTTYMKWVAQHVCREVILKELCIASVLLGGLNHYNVNETRVPVYISHTPAGTSVKNVVHFVQMVRSKKCMAYDYNNEKDNFDHYNQTTAPVYNISNMHVPTYLFYGGKDELADPTDVANIIESLPNIKEAIEIPEYKHLDFIWGLDASKKVYEKILNILPKYGGRIYKNANNHF